MIRTNVKNLEDKARRAKVSDLPVKDFMTTKVFTVTSGTKIHSAVKMLSVHGISGAPVVDASGHILGVISEYDLLLQAATMDVSDPIEYSEKVTTLNLDDTLNKAIVLLYKTKYRRLPVVDATKKVVGVVSRIDVLNKLMGL